MRPSVEQVLTYTYRREQVLGLLVPYGDVKRHVSNDLSAQHQEVCAPLQGRTTAATAPVYMEM